MRLHPLLTTAVVLTAAAGAEAQCIALRVSDASGSLGEFVDVAVFLDNPGTPVEGWQWGVCDDDLVTVTSGDVAEGPALDGREFSVHTIAVEFSGWTVSALLDGEAVLEPGYGHELYVVTYALDLIGTSSLTFCDSLGDPAVEVDVTAGGDSVEPYTTAGAIRIDTAPAAFRYSMAALDATYDPTDVTGGEVISVELVIEEDSANPGFPSDTQGFSMAIAHDGALVNAIAMDPIGEMAALNGGAGPNFFGVILEPSYGADDGAVVGVAYSLMGGVYMQFDRPKAVIEVDYEVVDLSALEENLDGLCTTLAWEETLGTPDVTNTMIAGGVDYSPDVADGRMFLLPEEREHFERGDCNDDAQISLVDAIFFLNYLFDLAAKGTPDPGCLAACDPNGDAQLELADAISFLGFLFLDGDAPVPPYPDCGSADPRLESCSAFESCR